MSITATRREQQRAITRSTSPTGAIRAVLMTSGLKADGIDLVPKGARLDRYRANPVLMTVHDRGNLPIGRVDNIEVLDDRITGELRFSSADPVARIAEAKVREGIVNAVSIGFEVHTVQFGTGRATDWTLLETSLVGVPLDDQALVYARSYALSARQVDAVGARSLLGAFEYYTDRLATEDLRRKVRRIVLAIVDDGRPVAG